MKICIMVSNSLKKDPRVIKQIYTAKAIGAEVVFLGFEDIYLDYEFLDRLEISYKIINLEKKYIGKLNNIFKKISRKLQLFFKPISYLRRLRPDIFHVNDFDMLPIAYYSKKTKKQKIIYDSHEIYTENIDIYNRKIMKTLISIYERFLIRRVNCVITVSGSSALYLSNKYNISVPMVITNSPLRYRGEFLPKSTQFEVLYQGLLYKNRGYEEFVEASQYVDSNTNLVIRGHGSLLVELKRKANELKLKNVIFENSVEVNEIIFFASRSHVGVVLTKPVNENFRLSISNKIFEYIHAGVPVILSNIPEHVLINNKYNIGIIINDVTPLAISNAIKTLKENIDLYRILRDNTIKMSKIENWENEQKKLINIYKSI